MLLKVTVAGENATILLFTDPEDGAPFTKGPASFQVGSMSHGDGENEPRVWGYIVESEAPKAFAPVTDPPVVSHYLRDPSRREPPQPVYYSHELRTQLWEDTRARLAVCCQHVADILTADPGITHRTGRYAEQAYEIVRA